MRSGPRLYKEEQLRLRESLERAVRRVGGWCETAASLRGYETENRGTYSGEVSRLRILNTCYSELLIV
jgi:hypothetical protein